MIPVYTYYSRLSLFTRAPQSPLVIIVVSPFLSSGPFISWSAYPMSGGDGAVHWAKTLRNCSGL